TDVFVVGGEHPATPALFGAVVRVVVIVIVGGRWNVTGGNAAHAWLLPAGPNPFWVGGPYSDDLAAMLRARLAQGRNVGGLDDRVGTLAVMAPRLPRVGGDRCDFDIVEQVAERRHCRARAAIQDDFDLLLHGGKDGFVVAGQRGEGGRHALAIGLVAGNAVGGVHLLATFDQIGQFIGFSGVVGGSLHGLTLFVGPVFVVGLFHDLDHDRHEGVILATELGTLTTIDAGFFGAEPGVAQNAGHGVLLDAEIGNHPGVDHVVGRKHDAHLLVDRHHHVAIGFDQVGVGLGRGAVDLVAWCGKVGEELDALCRAVEVFIAPLPLITRDQDREVGAGGVFHGHHGARGRNGHGNDDEERNDGPGDFDADVFVKLGGNGALGLSVHQDG